MRITLFLLLAGMVSVSANSYSQKITFKGRDVAFSTIIEVIRKQSGHTVFSTKEVLNSAAPVTLDVRGISLDDFLKRVTDNQPIGYQAEDKTISFFKKTPVAAKPNTLTVQQQRINGQVLHAQTHEAIQGVVVRIKGTNIAASTNAKGEFELTGTDIPLDATVSFRYIGMQPLDIKINGQKALNVQLEPTTDAIKDVVVTGIYQRSRESFTGSSATYTAQELRMVGNQNVLQSLKTLDPSFAIAENNLFGSDPNRLPDVEIRGKSSVIGLTDEFQTNPNQPLFILDGFESTLAIISDLSMDRVESITLLKDAAAAAIYGSKAANGVVVVETKRPAPGQLRVNYTLNGQVNFADLTDYNLMNASEKLQFELLSGFYGLLNSEGKIILGANVNSEANYLDRLKEVQRGVNTYWPNEPLRTALTQRHTLFAEGGDASLRYSISLNHGMTSGVMKGSDRQATNGNVRILYRRGNMSFSNNLSLDNVIANKETSPFSDFSRANPYHRKYNDDSVKMLLEDFGAMRSGEDPVFSPLYDVSNLNINEQGSQGFTNNFELEWRATESLRVRGRMGLRSFSTRDEVFRSPFNTEFLQTDPLERGSYRETNGKNLNYDGDLAVTYGKLFAEKHMLNAVLGARMEQNSRQQSAYQVFGFIDDEFSNPNFALGYRSGQRAQYSESIRRGASVFINTGYAYDQRYLADATLRSDGSSVFGSSRRFSYIWSFGLAWNAHNESRIKEWDWINQLRLRATIGNPGNQNFSDYISMRVYRYNNENRNPFGASTIVENMGNSNLQWQTTLDRNMGLDFTTYQNRLRFNIDYFIKSTDPLLVHVSLPSSTGVSSVAQNIGGQLTRGFTVASDYTLLRRNEFNWRVNLNMRQLKAEYRNIGNQLNNFNETNKESRNMIRYYDGGSPSDLWAVRSVGIDAATGREIFLNKNGEQTFVHNFQDEVVVGNSDPDLEGIIGTSIFYKGFSASINLRYRLGGQAFMKTLYDKVENISARSVVLNQDKRALYDRWKQPGDNAKFKAISRTELTPMSSRFVADNDMLIGESFSIGYESTTAAWLKPLRASSVTFRAYMNDIFHISTIKNERGIDYPFARSVSFSAGIRF